MSTSTSTSSTKKRPPHVSKSASEPVTSIHGPSLCTATVLEQCNHLLQLQDSLIRNSFSVRKEVVERSRVEREELEKLRKELEKERVEHTKTKCQLLAEEEKAQMALTEVQVLSKQLEREKATFEKAFGLLKSQALCDSTKSESLLAKCSALESLVAGKDVTIATLEGQLHELTERIKELKRAHKTELQEMNIRMQQEMYLAKHFRELEGGSEEKKRTVGTSRTNRYSTRGRTKHKLKDL